MEYDNSRLLSSQEAFLGQRIHNLSIKVPVAPLLSVRAWPSMQEHEPLRGVSHDSQYGVEWGGVGIVTS